MFLSRQEIIQNGRPTNQFIQAQCAKKKNRNLGPLIYRDGRRHDENRHNYRMVIKLHVNKNSSHYFWRKKASGFYLIWKLIIIKLWFQQLYVFLYILLLRCNTKQKYYIIQGETAVVRGPPLAPPLLVDHDGVYNIIHLPVIMCRYATYVCLMQFYGIQYWTSSIMFR